MVDGKEFRFSVVAATSTTSNYDRPSLSTLLPRVQPFAIYHLPSTILQSAALASGLQALELRLIRIDVLERDDVHAGVDNWLRGGLAVLEGVQDLDGFAAPAEVLLSKQDLYFAR